MIVYCATNKLNDFKYVGITTKKLEIRQKQHFYQAFNEKKKNYFYRALRKYGWENFEWSIIYKASTIEELLEKESFFIKEFSSFKNKGYNETIGGRGCFGWKHSEETKQKIAIASKVNNKGKSLTKEQKEKIRLFFKGKTYEEIMGIDNAKKRKDKQSKSGKERYKTEKGKQRIEELSKTFDEKFGEKYSQEIKQKMSNSHKKKLDKDGKRTDISQESIDRIKEKMSGINNPNFIFLTDSQIDEIKNLYIKNNFVLNKIICQNLGKSRYILERTLKKEGIWKKKR